MSLFTLSLLAVRYCHFFITINGRWPSSYLWAYFSKSSSEYILFSIRSLYLISEAFMPLLLAFIKNGIRFFPVSLSSRGRSSFSFWTIAVRNFHRFVNYRFFVYHTLSLIIIGRGFCVSWPGFRVCTPGRFWY